MLFDKGESLLRSLFLKKLNFEKQKFDRCTAVSTQVRWDVLKTGAEIAPAQGAHVSATAPTLGSIS